MAIRQVTPNRTALSILEDMKEQDGELIVARKELKTRDAELQCTRVEPVEKQTRLESVIQANDHSGTSSCTKHVQKFVFMCIECDNTPLCSQCYWDEHADHTVVPVPLEWCGAVDVKKRIEERREDLVTAIAKVKQAIDVLGANGATELNMLRKRGQEMVEELIATFSAAEDRVKAVMDAKLAVLTNQQHAMTHRVDTYTMGGDGLSALVSQSSFDREALQRETREMNKLLEDPCELEPLVSDQVRVRVLVSFANKDVVVSGDDEAVGEAVNKGTVPPVQEDERDDREKALDAVRKDGRALQHMSPHFRDDKMVVLAAVSQNGSAVAFASQQLKGDPEIALAAVSQCGYALLRLPPVLRERKDIVMEAVKKDGGVLTSVPARLRDKDVVLASVSQLGTALRLAPTALRGDKQVVLAAVRQNAAALAHASAKLRNDRDIVAAAREG